MSGVFPAYAGMSPMPSNQGTNQQRFPRLRGDEPGFPDPTVVGPVFSPPTRG